MKVKPPSIEEVRDGIWRVKIPVPYDVGSVSVYLVDFPPLVMIDSGPRMPGLFEAITRVIAGQGIDPGDIETLIVTHGHIDHHGIAARFREGLDAEVWIHREDVPRLNHSAEFTDETFSYYRDLMGRMGVPERMHERFGTVSTWFTDLAEPCVCDRELEGGELIEGERLTGKVLHCPGHCAGQIILEVYPSVPSPSMGEGRGGGDRPDGWPVLITGDHLLPDITPNPELYYPTRGTKVSGLGDYVESLHLVETLGAALALPGHGEPFEDPGARAAEVLAHHDERAELIYEIYSGGTKSLWDITLQVFEKEIASGEDIQVFLALKEVLGHLEILADDGRVPSVLPSDLSGIADQSE